MQPTKFLFIFTAALLLGGFALAGSARAETSNLVPNPGMEDSTASSSAPDHWSQDRWGKNTAVFSYMQEGNNSDHSLKVELTARQSGDAKWYFEPVPVKGATEYVFSDYYKSNKPTAIVAMSLDANGKESYFDIAQNIPASADWKKLIYSFKTPADAVSLTVFHLIRRVGWVQIDDMSLIPIEPVSMDNAIPNGGLEIPLGTDPTSPDQWGSSDWGTSTPVYEYLNEGHGSSSHSIKVTVSDYESGDAKWIYTPQPLQRGGDYKFTAWYKTDTKPHVVAWYLRDDGTEDYYGMPDPRPNGSGDWQMYSDTFSVPLDVKAVSVFMFISSNGWLQTDDYSLAPYSFVGFDKARVTLTFDDGFETNATSVLPVLKNQGLPATYCYSTEYLEGVPSSENRVKKISGAGIENCAHTITHRDITTLNDTELTQELTHPKTYLETLTGKPVKTFASPYGIYDDRTVSEIQKYYDAHRTTDEGYNSLDNLDPYRLRVQNMLASTTLDQFKSWVTKAQKDKTWLILVFHKVDQPSNIEYFDTAKANFNAEMRWLAGSGVAVQDLSTALAQVKAQKQP